MSRESRPDSNVIRSAKPLHEVSTTSSLFTTRDPGLPLIQQLTWLVAGPCKGSVVTCHCNDPTVVARVYRPSVGAKGDTFYSVPGLESSNSLKGTEGLRVLDDSLQKTFPRLPDRSAICPNRLRTNETKSLLDVRSSDLRLRSSRHAAAPPIISECTQ